MKIIDILDESKILLNYHFISKKRLFETMAGMLAGDSQQSLGIYHGLIEREKLGNTSLGNGVAVPHGRCLAEKQIKACLIKTSHPIDYESIDDVPVNIVIGIAFPIDANLTDKAFMKDTAHLFRQHRLFRKMMAATSKKQLFSSILEEFQVCSS